MFNLRTLLGSRRGRRSCSTPKRPGSMSNGSIASSRSAASNLWMACQPAKASSATSTRNEKCRKRHSRNTGCHARSSRTSRCSPTSSTTSSPSSATHRWWCITRPTTAASSTPSWRAPDGWNWSASVSSTRCRWHGANIPGRSAIGSMTSASVRRRQQLPRQARRDARLRPAGAGLRPPQRRLLAPLLAALRLAPIHTHHR